MSLPHLLLVDDSEAVLAFEAKVLQGRFALSTAMNGREALAKVRQLRPDAMLLDLSMPELGGQEVLAALRGDAEFEDLPVLIVSSELHREAELRSAGAQGFLGKPLTADTLLASVERLLTDAADQARRRGLTVLFLRVGDLEIGLPLAVVERVLMQPTTEPLPGGPGYLSRMFLFEGEPLAVLDLGLRLGVAHRAALVDRKLVLLDRSRVPFAIQVDQIEDPEDFAAEAIRSPGQLGFVDQGGLGELIAAVVQTERGVRGVLDPRALVSRKALRELPGLLRLLAEQPVAALAAPAGTATDRRE